MSADKFTVLYNATTVHSDEMLTSIAELGYQPFVVSSDANFKALVKSSRIPDLISAALREAGRKEQFVFIDFHAPWCGACKKLEETTLSDPGVKAVLSRYVVVKIDTDEHPSIGKHFNVVGLPTLLVVNLNANELYRHAGLIDPDPLSKDLSELAVDL